MNTKYKPHDFPTIIFDTLFYTLALYKVKY